jgi:hypothetical protein
VIASSPLWASKLRAKEIYECPGVLGENVNTLLLVSPSITCTAGPHGGAVGVAVEATVGGHSTRVHVPATLQL